MFGINGGELVILLLVIALVVGPERLPGYAEQLGALVRRARSFAGEARRKVDSELADAGADIDWAALDPRRYDPRRIVRDALLEEPAGPLAAAAVGGAAAPGGGLAPGARQRAVAGQAPARSVPVPSALPTGVPAPYDDEAT